MPNESSTAPDLKIARLTFLQAIAVALITAIASVVGTLLAAHHSESGVGRWHKITVDQVSYPRGEARTAIRIVLEVNGQAYSYPSRTIWADIGADMSTESFPIPDSLDGYKVHFQARLRNPDGNEEVRQSQNMHVSESDIPFTGKYELFPIDGEFSRSASEYPLVLRYRID